MIDLGIWDIDNITVSWKIFERVRVSADIDLQNVMKKYLKQKA